MGVATYKDGMDRLRAVFAEPEFSRLAASIAITHPELYAFACERADHALVEVGTAAVDAVNARLRELGIGGVRLERRASRLQTPGIQATSMGKPATATHRPETRQLGHGGFQGTLLMVLCGSGVGMRRAVSVFPRNTRSRSPRKIRTIRGLRVKKGAEAKQVSHHRGKTTALEASHHGVEPV